MCSIIFSRTNIELNDAAIAAGNRYARFRGPDSTSRIQFSNLPGSNYLFLHNLLDISGHTVTQPLVDGKDGQRLIILFNGEIYNHRDLGSTLGDTTCIAPAYRNHGSNMGAMLDGEFSIVIYDEEQNSLHVFTDPFLTKPLYISQRIETGELAVATCASSLISLGFSNVEMAKPNTTYEFRFSENSFKVITRFPIQHFDTKQHKDSYEAWTDSFISSVAKRARHGAHFPTVYLSSGYDSGAICQALNISGIPYDTFSITSGENLDILRNRIRVNRRGSCRKATCVGGLSPKMASKMQSDIALNVEPFLYQHEDLPGKVGSVHTDGGAIGVNYLAGLARQRGNLVNLSGSGADEIISDYGFGGTKFYSHSEFGGLFPDCLDGFFPWRKFYGDSQRSYLFKDEFILGRSGIEGRYPFLDRKVVQEFLWLTAALKNQAYKAPVAHFLNKFSYPYETLVKRGFAPLSIKRTFTSYLRKIFPFI